jgi:hypothetical protein
MDVIKSEPNCNGDSCLTSSDSDHGTIGIKEDKDSAVMLPVKMAEDVVSDDVGLFVLLSKCYVSTLTFEFPYNFLFINNQFISDKEHVMS